MKRRLNHHKSIAPVLIAAVCFLSLIGLSNQAQAIESNIIDVQVRNLRVKNSTGSRLNTLANEIEYDICWTSPHHDVIPDRMKNEAIRVSVAESLPADIADRCPSSSGTGPGSVLEFTLGNLASAHCTTGTVAHMLQGAESGTPADPGRIGLALDFGCNPGIDPIDDPNTTNHLYYTNFIKNDDPVSTPILDARFEISLDTDLEISKRITFNADLEQVEARFKLKNVGLTLSPKRGPQSGV